LFFYHGYFPNNYSKVKVEKIFELIIEIHPKFAPEYQIKTQAAQAARVPVFKKY